MCQCAAATCHAFNHDTTRVSVKWCDNIRINVHVQQSHGLEEIKDDAQIAVAAVGAIFYQLYIRMRFLATFTKTINGIEELLGV